jgi:hypothetical protein
VTKFDLPALSPSVSVLTKITLRPGVARRAAGVKRGAIAPALRSNHDGPPKELAADRATEFRQPTQSGAPVSVMHAALRSPESGRWTPRSAGKEGRIVPAPPSWRDGRVHFAAMSPHAGRLPFMPSGAPPHTTIRTRTASVNLLTIKDNDQRASPISTRSSKRPERLIADVGRGRATGPVGEKANWNQAAAAQMFRAATISQRQPLSGVFAPTKADGSVRHNRFSHQRRASAPSDSPLRAQVSAGAKNEPGDGGRQSSGAEDGSEATQSPMAEIHLDGAVLGQWVSDHIERLLSRLPTSPTFLDLPSVALQPGMPSRA